MTSEPDLLIQGDASGESMTAHWSARIIDGRLHVALEASPALTSTVAIPQDPSCSACVTADYLLACIADIEQQLRGRHIPMWRLDQMHDPVEQARRRLLECLPRCAVHDPIGADQ